MNNVYTTLLFVFLIQLPQSLECIKKCNYSIDPFYLNQITSNLNNEINTANLKLYFCKKLINCHINNDPNTEKIETYFKEFTGYSLFNSMRDPYFMIHF